MLSQAFASVASLRSATQQQSCGGRPDPRLGMNRLPVDTRALSKYTISESSLLRLRLSISPPCRVWCLQRLYGSLARQTQFVPYARQRRSQLFRLPQCPLPAHKALPSAAHTPPSSARKVQVLLSSATSLYLRNVHRTKSVPVHNIALTCVIQYRLRHSFVMNRSSIPPLIASMSVGRHV